MGVGLRSVLWLWLWLGSGLGLRSAYLLLADAVHTVTRLVLGEGVPPRLAHDHGARTREVEAHAAPGEGSGLGSGSGWARVSVRSSVTPHLSDMSSTGTPGSWKRITWPRPREARSVEGRSVEVRSGHWGAVTARKARAHTLPALPRPASPPPQALSWPSRYPQVWPQCPGTPPPGVATVRRP